MQSELQMNCSNTISSRKKRILSMIKDSINQNRLISIYRRLKMSIRKIITYGFIVSLITSDTIVSRGNTCQHSNSSLAKLFLGEPLTTHQLPNRKNVPTAVKSQIQPDESIVIASSIEAKVNQKLTEIIQKTAPLLINHLHTQANVSSAKSIKKTLLSEDNRSQQTSQIYDKNGLVHQIHKWKDTKGRRHQIDQWTDSTENVHQCHRFEDEDGCIHEAIQVTSPQGIVINQHFNKDKDGKITKIQSDSLHKILSKEPEPERQPITKKQNILTVPINIDKKAI